MGRKRHAGETAILHVGHISPHPTWSVPRHQHPHHELIIVEQGRHSVKSDDAGQHRTVAGNVLFYPAGWWHQDVSDPDAPVEMIYIAFFGNFAKDFSKVTDRSGRIRALARWLNETCKAGKLNGGPRGTRDKADPPWNAPLCAAFFQAILAEFRRLEQLPEESSLVEQTRAHIFDNLSRPLSLATLAREAGMSVRHLVRRYQAETGCSPMADARQARLQYARDLYEHTELPLKAIAPRVNYNSEQELSRAFRKQFGYPLGSLRSRRPRTAADGTI